MPLRHVARPTLPRRLALDGDLSRRLYLAPAGIAAGKAAEAAVAAGTAWPLAGGPLMFTQATILLRDADTVVETTAPLAEVIAWSEAEGEAVADHVGRLIHRIGARRTAFAGLDLDRPLVMGIVNTTPDSFSDGGDFFSAEAAVAHGLALLEAGADILDVGGESTRPGSAPVEADEEMRRVLPVIQALAQRGAVVSVDTRHAATMAAALEAGVRIINDVTALGDVAAMRAVAASDAPVVLMHMQGEPRSMQAAPDYAFAPLDVYDFLADRIAACEAAGIARTRICTDVGIGFGKTLDHNLAILARLGLYHGLGCPMLLGVSRKSFVAKICGDIPARQRLPGSLATALAGLDHGTQILRVHDVAETVQATAVWRAIRSAD